MTDRITSFITSQNFCTGSQSDYSTCIMNNMRFMAFSDDTYKPAGYAGLTISDTTSYYLSGDVFVDPHPVAIANIFSRVKMANSFGGVSFRCSEVFDRPRLPLPSLQDLGIPSQDIINIIGIDPSDPSDPDDDPLLFEGIPLSADDTITGWMLNALNLLIGYTTSTANSMTNLKEISGIILGSLNYYELPDKSIVFKEEVEKNARIYSKYLEFDVKIKSYADLNELCLETQNTASDIASIANSYLQFITDNMMADIITPLSIITPDTDFTDFDFSITDGVADKIKEYTTDYYPFILSYGYAAKQVTSLFGIPPVYPIDDSVYAEKIIALFSGLFVNLVAEMLNQIKGLYQATTSMSNVLKALEANNDLFNTYKTYKPFWYTLALSKTNDAKYEDIILKTTTLTDFFSLIYTTGYLPLVILDLYDPDDYDSLDLVADELDLYFEDIGNVSNINLYNLIDSQKALYGTSGTAGDLTITNLGGDFKDSGNFYYADIAYSVGFGKLSYLKSIQIDDEYYDVVTEDGDDKMAISESGCTRYRFTRHVLPTYDVEVEMYIYPGTLNQPHCPTINKYHNFLTSKYYGMFTKQDGEDMGVYVYKGYRPMFGTVEEVIQLGKMDLNAINLNDPSLDQQSYEAMLMKEIKNLTNASSIDGKPISTDDFKYYLSSKLVYPDKAANYPGLAIVEFKNFPLGSSIKLPKIKLNIIAEDQLT